MGRRKRRKKTHWNLWVSVVLSLILCVLKKCAVRQQGREPYNSKFRTLPMKRQVKNSNGYHMVVEGPISTFVNIAFMVWLYQHHTHSIPPTDPPIKISNSSLHVFAQLTNTRISVFLVTNWSWATYFSTYLFLEFELLEGSLYQMTCGTN